MVYRFTAHWFKKKLWKILEKNSKKQHFYLSENMEKPGTIFYIIIGDFRHDGDDRPSQGILLWRHHLWGIDTGSFISSGKIHEESSLSSLDHLILQADF